MMVLQAHIVLDESISYEVIHKLAIWAHEVMLVPYGDAVVPDQPWRALRGSRAWFRPVVDGRGGPAAGPG